MYQTSPYNALHSPWNGSSEWPNCLPTTLTFIYLKIILYFEISFPSITCFNSESGFWHFGAFSLLKDNDDIEAWCLADLLSPQVKMHFKYRSQVQVAEWEHGYKHWTGMMAHSLSATDCLHHTLILLLQLPTKERVLLSHHIYWKVCQYYYYKNVKSTSKFMLVTQHIKLCYQNLDCMVQFVSMICDMSWMKQVMISQDTSYNELQCCFWIMS